MATNSAYKIKLPAKTEYSACFWYTKGVRGDCPNPKQLLNAYNGELDINVQALDATFYSPSKSECIDIIKNPNCILEAHLPSASLEKLSLENVSLKKHLESLGINYNSKASPTDITGNNLDQRNEDVPRQDNSSSITSSQDLKEPGFFDPLVQNGPVALGTITIAILGFFIVKKFLESMNKGSSLKSSRKTIIQEKPLASSSARFLPSGQSLNNFVSEELKRQLHPLTEQLQTVKSKVERLETELELLGLSQQLQSSGPKPRGLFSEPISQQVSLNSLVPIQSIQPISPLPAAPLSVDLIKKAVASGDYSLISIHPHLFLSETLDSQKGLEEVKCFSIDGDQSQASKKTQSEFIAINCNDETYLIPNILPNAADPARTLKRHADKNNIYRNGQGGNFLNLEQLAVVQRNGDRFDLKKPGQIV